MCLMALQQPRFSRGSSCRSMAISSLRYRFTGELQARRRAAHQHINLGTAMIVVIPLTVDTDVGIASRVPSSSIHLILLLHPTNILFDPKVTGRDPNLIRIKGRRAVGYLSGSGCQARIANHLEWAGSPCITADPGNKNGARRRRFAFPVF